MNMVRLSEFVPDSVHRSIVFRTDLLQNLMDYETARFFEVNKKGNALSVVFDRIKATIYRL